MGTHTLSSYGVYNLRSLPQAFVPVVEDLNEELPRISSSNELRDGHVVLNLLDRFIDQAFEI